MEEKYSPTFDLSKLTADKQEIRQLGIETLYRSTSKTNVSFTNKDAENVYDRMQQNWIDEGVSDWYFYKTEEGT